MAGAGGGERNRIVDVLDEYVQNQPQLSSAPGGGAPFGQSSGGGPQQYPTKYAACLNSLGFLVAATGDAPVELSGLQSVVLAAQQLSSLTPADSTGTAGEGETSEEKITVCAETTHRTISLRNKNQLTLISVTPNTRGPSTRT